MDAITVQTLWVMCDIIEDTMVDDALHLPLLRAIPNTQYHQGHSLHAFANPHYKKIIKRSVDYIKIRICEDLTQKDSILEIFGDVFLRLDLLDAA